MFNRGFAVLAVVLLAVGTMSAEEILDLKVPAGLKPLKIPADNPLTEAKVELGKQLYFDPRLSGNNEVSCASCHDPKHGWADSKDRSVGVPGERLGRHSPTIINAGYQRFQFWDGRAGSLEEQALGPIQSPAEMNMNLDTLTEKLNAIPGYRNQFKQVFGTEVTAENIGKAIASFERTVLSGNAAYDRYKAGDEAALSEGALRGRKLFFGKANCSACHAGSNFTDNGFHNIGVGIDLAEPDVGRQSISKLSGDRGSFKTPTLRDIDRTAPYMHDGSMATLEDVIEHYSKGGIDNPQLDEEIFKLDLTDQEKKDLVLFLKEGLASQNYPMVEVPTLPE